MVQLINSRARGQFAINSKGRLYEVTGKGELGSTYYRDKLVQAINAPGKINIHISATYTDDKGNTKQTDKDAGGGYTLTETLTKTDQATKKVISKTTSADVTISGNDNKNLQDTNGQPLRDDPADILAHELVGHAIPAVVKSDTGNAVDNENKVRKELPKGTDQQRKQEPNHVE
ncbi:MAG: hypothetical protein ACTHMI_09465 [Mucilaginibacter sp.]